MDEFQLRLLAEDYEDRLSQEEMLEIQEELLEEQGRDLTLALAIARGYITDIHDTGEF